MNDSKTKARLFTGADLPPDARVTPEPDQAHYLLKVMRAENGDGVRLFNGRDGEWLGEIEQASKKSCLIRLTEQLRPQRDEPGPWLAFAPLKKSATDFLVEKATELGASRLIPVFTEHTNTGRVKTPRLGLIAMEAAEQCDRLSVPSVAEALSFTEFLSQWPEDRTLLVPDETGGGRPLARVLEETGDGPHGFLIGPEGGFARSELDALDDLPFVGKVGLGPRILRAETAALAVLACYQAVAGDWDGQPRFNNGYFFNARR